MHSIYIWNAVLAPVQMKHVTSALRAQIGGSPDIAGNLVGPAVVQMPPSETAYEQVCPAGNYLDAANGDCTSPTPVPPVFPVETTPVSPVLPVETTPIPPVFPVEITQHNGEFPWNTTQQNDEFLTLLFMNPPLGINTVSYTHLTLPTNREV